MISCWKLEEEKKTAYEWFLWWNMAQSYDSTETNNVHDDQTLFKWFIHQRFFDLNFFRLNLF